MESTIEALTQDNEKWVKERKEVRYEESILELTDPKSFSDYQMELIDDIIPDPPPVPTSPREDSNKFFAFFAFFFFLRTGDPNSFPQ